MKNDILLINRGGVFEVCTLRLRDQFHRLHDEIRQCELILNNLCDSFDAALTRQETKPEDGINHE